ncbi:hypothetical protein CDAR_512521 [Caerostris darwini]|uniref:Uncharacterized protein n=1 Tax=Caerostris darwini TaxID=1538125 RepID=A0AAV4RJ15_9ARAC|nr:hypothetical protein CDAR_512521 [Caerostris darwini]
MRNNNVRTCKPKSSQAATEFLQKTGKIPLFTRRAGGRTTAPPGQQVCGGNGTSSGSLPRQIKVFLKVVHNGNPWGTYTTPHTPNSLHPNPNYSTVGRHAKYKCKGGQNSEEEGKTEHFRIHPPPLIGRSWPAPASDSSSWRRAKLLIPAESSAISSHEAYNCPFKELCLKMNYSSHPAKKNKGYGHVHLTQDHMVSY